MGKKRGQITVFIALGVVIVFVFFFLIQLNRNLVEAELRLGQEDVLSKIFKKESLRIFVEDCLRDELREALQIVARQGRVWSDQPGGTTIFEEGVTGRHLENDARVSYALTYVPFATSLNAYPCTDENGGPSFCQYMYPDQRVKFGKVQRWEQTIERDIGGYLKVQAQQCIDDYLREHAPSADFDPGDFTLTVDLREEGVSVEAFYPLGFNVGGEDFFHLSVFDFFYPSELKKFLRSTFFFPMEMDWRYMDFNYTEDTILKPGFSYQAADSSGVTVPTFAADVQQLETTMERERLPNGDTLFTFHSPFPHVLDTPQPYTFHLLRQNRPPALNYIGHLSCPAGEEGYDYLIIPGDDDLGDVTIKLQAQDPDDDGEEGLEVQYRFDALDAPLGEFVEEDSDELIMTKGEVSERLSPGRKYELTAHARDAFSSDISALEDWQLVRLWVDRPLEEGVNLKAQVALPYTFRNAAGGLVSYEEYHSGPGITAFSVSPEDPLIISVTMPQESPAAEVSLNQITYTKTANGESFTVEVPAAGQSCLNFPGGEGCDLQLYNLNLQLWPISSETAAPFSHGEQYLVMVGGDGTITADYSARYCGGENAIEASHEISLNLVQCLPHVDPRHPYPFIPSKIYHQYEFEVDADGNTKFDNPYRIDTGFSPLSATHTCCKEDFTFQADQEVCFRSPQADCTGRSPGLSGLSTSQRKKIQEQLVATCDNKQGNVCGADAGHQSYELVQGASGNPELRCGFPGLVMPTCGGIADRCKGKLAWEYLTTAAGAVDGWCHEDMGCGSFCTSRPAIIAGGTGTFEADFRGYTSFGRLALNKYATEKLLEESSPVVDNNDFGITCGCRNPGDICDFNFDGSFRGTCQNSPASSGTLRCCSGGSCAPN